MTHTLAGAGRRIRRDLLLLLDWHHPMPTADWWPANHTDPPKLLGVKDTDSKGSRPTLYGFNVRSFSEKPHAVTASAYSEASRPHKRYQVHLNAHHIPHTLLLPLPQTTARHHHLHTGWQSCQKPNSKFTIYIDAYTPSHFSLLTSHQQETRHNQ